MTPRVTKPLIIALVLCTAVWAARAAQGQDAIDRGGPIFFVGVVGQGPTGQSKVLLRWYSVTGDIPFTRFSVYRKAGLPHAAGLYSKVSTTTQLRNVPLIRSIFERTGERRILIDIIEQLNATSDTEVSFNNYVQRLLEILEDSGSCDSCAIRARLLAHSNYGVAIVEGLGYLDRVTPGTYSYELRTSSGSGTDDLVIGRITVDASAVTELPPPTTPEEVTIEGLRGDRKVFLKWDFSADLEDHMPLNFGFNVYRYNGQPRSGDTFETLNSAGLLEKINRLPIALNNSTTGDRSADEQYDFMDDNLSFDKEGRLGTEFTAGQRFAYWVTARDLLGQDGEPSDAVSVIVQDRKAPPIPRGLTTTEDRIGSDRRIVVHWDANADGDTVAYQIYRYRYYHHVGREGPPFDDDSELAYTVTEGLIAARPEPSSATVAYRDTDISVADDEGRAYWYSVRALDSAGNASPLSPAVRGVLYDRSAPVPPDTIELCTTRYVCEPQFRREDVTPEPDIGTVLRFSLESFDPRVTTVRVVRVDRGKHTVLYHGEITPGSPIALTDTFREPGTGVSDDISYLFFCRTVLGEWCGPHQMPGAFQAQIMQFGDVIVDIRVLFTVKAEKTCVDATLPGRIPHDPRADVGTSNVEVTVTLTDDAVGAVLYRAEDCTDFHRVVAERAGEAASTVTLIDGFRPGSTAIICYGVRLFDENQNLSGMTYLESHVVFSGNETVEPTLESLTTLGSETSPEVRVRWFGSSDGISGYRVHFATGTFTRPGLFSSLSSPNLSDSTSVSAVYPVDDLTYDDSTGLWSIRTSSLDNSGSAALETNTRYRVWVDAVDHLGISIDGKNSKLFTWGDSEREEERLAWPIRPLPDEQDALPVHTTIPDADGVTRGIAIQISDPGHSQFDEVNPLEILVVNTPFIVYRKRTDLSGQPFVQIGPLIDEIHTDRSGNARDPFIRDYSVAAYYMDYVGLVKGASYQYVVVELDDEGELANVYGPSSGVTVTFD